MVLAQGLGKRSEDILYTLRREHEQGVYPVGGRFPSEEELCRRFKVSRSTIRRAIARLVVENRLEPRQGVGTIVRQCEQVRAESRVIAVMFPFDAESLVRVQDYTLQHHYLLTPCSRLTLDWDPAHERQFLRRVQVERYQGLLVCCTPVAPTNIDLLQTMQADGMRIIHIEPYRMSPPDGNYIYPDYKRAGYMATTRLLLAGYTSLVFTGTESDWPSALLFRHGFIEALDDQCGGYDPKRHYYEFPTYADVSPERQAALEAFLTTCSPSTGFVCRSNDLGMTISETLTRMGRSVPDDYGIIGIRYITDPVPERNEVDHLDFERISGVLQAIDCVTSDTTPDVQALLPPVYIRHGSIRAQEAHDVLVP